MYAFNQRLTLYCKLSKYCPGRQFSLIYNKIKESYEVVCAQHSVHPTGGSLRVFRQFAWLEAGSVKAALSHPAHQRVTPAVGRLGQLRSDICHRSCTWILANSFHSPIS